MRVPTKKVVIEALSEMNPKIKVKEVIKALSEMNPESPFLIRTHSGSSNRMKDYSPDVDDFESIQTFELNKPEGSVALLHLLIGFEPRKTGSKAKK